MPTNDRLSLDRLGALHLWQVMTATVEELGWDRIAVGGLVERASGVLGRDRRAPVQRLRRAHEGLDRLALDLRRRLDMVDTLMAEVARIDALTARIGDWSDADAAGRARLVADRNEAVAELLGREPDLAPRIVELLDGGDDLTTALGLARDEAQQARVDEVADILGLSRPAAESRVEEIDRQLARLLEQGHGAEAAAVAVSLAVTLELDLDEALEVAAAHGTEPIEALAWMATARGIGVTVPELLALDGLTRHFGVFDRATTGAVDHRVSEGDLLHVLAHPHDFTGPQVRAARAVLEEPALRARLDTAAANGDILGPARFGRDDPADRIISRADLQGFMTKARINVVLGDHASRIDVAADASANPDGFYSRADFERFIAENPELPPEVTAAAQTMLDAGWFDRTWFEQHRDELALGAAVLAGGTVIVLSAGTAAPLALSSAGALATAGAAGAAAAGGATLLVNRSGDAHDGTDGVAGNGFDGALVAISVAGLPASLSAIGSSSGLTRVAAVSAATSELTGVVASGGIDLVIPEELEDDIGQAASAVSQLTGAASIGFSTSRSPSHAIPREVHGPADGWG